MNMNAPGCRWEWRVPLTTLDNSVEPPIEGTLHVFALLCHNHMFLLILFNSLVKYLP